MVGDIDQALSMEAVEGGILETVDEDSREFQATPLSVARMPDLSDQDEEGQQQQEQQQEEKERIEAEQHRGPQQLLSMTDDEYSEALAGGSDSSMGIDTDMIGPSATNSAASGDDDNERKGKRVKFNSNPTRIPRSPSQRGSLRSPTHTSNGQHVQVCVRSMMSSIHFIYCVPGVCGCPNVLEFPGTPFYVCRFAQRIRRLRWTRQPATATN